MGNPGSYNRTFGFGTEIAGSEKQNLQNSLPDFHEWLPREKLLPSNIAQVGLSALADGDLPPNLPEWGASEIVFGKGTIGLYGWTVDEYSASLPYSGQGDEKEIQFAARIVDVGSGPAPALALRIRVRRVLNLSLDTTDPANHVEYNSGIIPLDLTGLVAGSWIRTSLLDISATPSLLPQQGVGYADESTYRHDLTEILVDISATLDPYPVSQDFIRLAHGLIIVRPAGSSRPAV